MKPLFIIPLVLMSLVSFPSWGLTMDDLVLRAGLYYKKFTAIPFTGHIEGRWQGTMKDGEKEGLWHFYHENGQLKRKGEFKNGWMQGPWVRYWDNGQLSLKGGYKNGKKEGVFEAFDRKGKIYERMSGTFTNGVKISD